MFFLKEAKLYCKVSSKQKSPTQIAWGFLFGITSI